MRFGVVGLANQFFGGDIWNRVGGPDLAVRMRIAGAHHRTAVFEDLHVIDLGYLSQLLELDGPGMNHILDVLRCHGGEGKVVARQEADYPAKAGLTFGDQQSAVLYVEAVVADARFKSREVVIKNEGAGVAWIKDPADPGISGAKVAGGVIFGLMLGRSFFNLPLPRPTGAMRRYQHPLVREGIQPAVGIFSQLQSRASAP